MSSIAVPSSAARAARVVVVALLCLALSGCFKADFDLSVHSDDTISGTMILAITKQLPNADQAVDQLSSQMPEGAVVEPWQDEQFVGVKATFDRVPISEFSAPTGLEGGDAGPGLRREGDFFILGEPDAEPSSGGTSELQPVYRVKFTFPGAVVEGNGKIDGKSIEWTDPDVPAYAKARATGSVLVPILVGAAAVLVLVAAALVVVLVLRNKQRTGTPGSPGAQPPPMYDPTSFSGATVDQPSTGWGGGPSGSTMPSGPVDPWGQPTSSGQPGPSPWAPGTPTPPEGDSRPGGSPWGRPDQP